jgi:hypothetical protein
MNPVSTTRSTPFSAACFAATSVGLDPLVAIVSSGISNIALALIVVSISRI